jgi:hypothetical protein
LNVRLGVDWRQYRNEHQSKERDHAPKIRKKCHGHGQARNQERRAVPHGWVKDLEKLIVAQSAGKRWKKTEVVGNVVEVDHWYAVQTRQ